MRVIGSSLPEVLRERASLQPNDIVFTFIDYEQDWDGVAASLTWAQLYRRSVNLANELRRHATTGDRAVILAPQGLDYIIAFFGALQAGIIAVPLSVPYGGVTDERADAVLRDASPAVVLTTSAVAGNVAEHIQPQSGEPAPLLVEVDALDLDSRAPSGARSYSLPEIAYLQYTSGSTRQPAGVMLSYANVFANMRQNISAYFRDYGNVAPPDTTVVSWLPFYHDMGLVVGTIFPVFAGLRAVITSPVSFLQRPARWMQLLATNSHSFSAAPNFAFELAARKTSDDDMAGLDLGDVVSILNGSERVQPATLKRFGNRFAPFNLHDTVLRPSYGMSEAMVYIATRTSGQPPEVVHFESEKLLAGHAKRCTNAKGTPLVSYGVPQSPTVRIVDPDTCIERPAGTAGEIWVHGDNVGAGYWGKPQETEHTFKARIIDPSAGTPEGPWLRTGDLGFFFEGELFIIGRIKDLLIVYGRNHSPDDIEATVQEITRGRCAAVAVPDGSTEQLVVIIELRDRGDSEDSTDRFAVVKRDVTSAISNSHGLSVADLVLVAAGSIPITTSGKVRRSACLEQYRQGQFARLDA